MKQLINDGWSFVKLPCESSFTQMQEAEKMPVCLPHDMLISRADDLYETADGWYVRPLCVLPEYRSQTLILSFDGVYMDAQVFLDGALLYTHRNGYTAFYVTLPEDLADGEHQIAVHIRHKSPNSRWYSGAGIYRDVNLLVLPKAHLVPDGLRVQTRLENGRWTLRAEAEVSSPPGHLPSIRAELLDEQGRLLSGGSLSEEVALTGSCEAEGESRGGLSGGSLSEEATLTGSCEAEGESRGETEGTKAAPRVSRLRCTLRPRQITPWSCDTPALYTLRLSLPGQTEEIRVGFRETLFTPGHGFFLNGRPVKLHGVCLHHDLGALGSAFHVQAAQRQLLLMKDMGANAVRTSHNPPARLFLDLCDELGLLVIDELYDMWEIPKTKYDHSRFFADTWQEDVSSWVRRDRCHPCVILWSIGNEIPDMHVSNRGRLWTKRLMREVEKHDTFQAPVTFGSNYMPWEGAQGCADLVKIPGYNYAEKYYEAHHREHPDWVIYGSETASLVQSRGIYHFPAEEGILSEEDLQCSSLLNSTTSWGSQNLCRMLSEDLSTPYSLGQFIWSGIDYIGEPTPYHTRSSYFGQADTACFPKDSYYLYQAMWTGAPMVHIAAIWDWNEGQLIDVPVMTNAPLVELFLNGRSLGRKPFDRLDPERCLPLWQIPYERGALTARAYGEGGAVLCEDTKYSFGEPERLVLSCKETALHACTGDLAFVSVSALDRDGHPVENAVNRVHLKISGPGVLLGTDNGDSTDPDGYTGCSRRLFSGRLLCILGAGDIPGTLRLEASGRGLKSAVLTLPVLSAEAACPPPSSSKPRRKGAGRRFLPLCRDSAPKEDVIFVRRIDLRTADSRALCPASPSALFQVRTLPEDAPPQELCFRVVNSAGVDFPGYELQPAAGGVKVTAQVNGKARLRASVRNGAKHPRILSEIELTSTGFPETGLDPYRFVSAALHDQAIGPVTAGNEHGAAFSRDSFSAIGFSRVDFGPSGSDELTLPVFALDSGYYEISLWDGEPMRGGTLLAKLPYQKRSIWNTYQEGTWKLDRPLTGLHQLWFSMERKIHLKGFRFTRQPALPRSRSAAFADQIYGDQFRIDGKAVKEIGNNVTLTFTDLFFEEDGTYTLRLEGATVLETQAISVHIPSPEGEQAYMCLFVQSPERTWQTFPLQIKGGSRGISFIFLPGSRFDFYSFRLEAQAETVD